MKCSTLPHYMEIIHEECFRLELAMQEYSAMLNEMLIILLHLELAGDFDGATRSEIERVKKAYSDFQIFNNKRLNDIKDLQETREAFLKQKIDNYQDQCH